MTISPGILGVSAAVLVAAVTAGTTFGAVPPMQQRDVKELLPATRIVASEYPAQLAFPDHYPLVTRARRYEIEDLGERGLYSQARYNYRAAYAAYYPEEDQDDAYARDADLAEPEPGPAPEPGVVLAEQAEPAAVPQAPAAAAANAPPEPVGPEVAEVGARSIDVAAELAARN